MTRSNRRGFGLALHWVEMHRWSALVTSRRFLQVQSNVTLSVSLKILAHCPATDTPRKPVGNYPFPLTRSLEDLSQSQSRRWVNDFMNLTETARPGLFVVCGLNQVDNGHKLTKRSFIDLNLLLKSSGIECIWNLSKYFKLNTALNRS